MFPRLAEQYRSVVHDLVMSLQALAKSLQDRGLAATCPRGSGAAQGQAEGGQLQASPGGVGSGR